MVETESVLLLSTGRGKCLSRPQIGSLLLWACVVWAHYSTTAFIFLGTSDFFYSCEII